MKIIKNLNWEPHFKNEIQIEDKSFSIILNKKEMEIMCSWNYGAGGSGAEYFSIPLNQLKTLITDLEKS